MERSFFIGSVGKPGKGYDEENLERCIKFKAHIMHKETLHKGAFEEIIPNSIIFLKYKEKLIAYGEVEKKSTDDNNDLEDWNCAVYVKEWFFYDKSNHTAGISRYGVGDATMNGDLYGTIKKINTGFGLQKMKEVDAHTPLYQKIINELNYKNDMNTYIDLLRSGKNLILTGAPGTGKTYLAKQIALQMLFDNTKEEELSPKEKEIFKEHCGFVQFHPSYDYTDFVEGLRPVRQGENMEIGFELKGGIFKAFCKKAIENTHSTSNFDEQYEKFINDIIETPIKFQTPVHKKPFSIEVNSKKSCHAIPDTEKATKMLITKDIIRDYVETGNIKDWKPYTTAIGDYIKNKYPVEKKTSKDTNNKPYIFIIDEINRGEISKIFGELFFSIDPGYRGKKGKVQTQYANIQSDDTIFDSELGQGWFYIPENVYIIGTMNDIDRSVESFDFAMRRRFTWKEITAAESAENMNLPAESRRRMTKLNDEISKIEGLNSSYHVGGAYFLTKNETYPDFEELWELKLHPLLKEYVRGMPDADSLPEKLKKAYNAAPNDENNG